MGLFISITSIYFFPSIVLGIILAIKIKSFMEVLVGFQSGIGGKVDFVADVVRWKS